MKENPPSRLGRFADRLSERLGRSSHVFLAVLLVLCAIEVCVDWNATLYEINVLRATLREKAVNYADLLRKAAEGGLLAYDWDELDRLSAGVFEDEDVVYVRFSDVLGNTIYDRLRSEYGAHFEGEHSEPFRTHYRHVMERDAAGMLNDPLALKARMERSRYRDFIQQFTDVENRLIAYFSKTPVIAHEPPPRALYQDRLADTSGGLDRELSYAIGAITTEHGDTYGVVLVAFRNAALNRAIFGKLMKGLAITLFFVGLILVQNILSRRAKLRLLDLESALGAARAAIRGALPDPPALGGRELGIAFAQADRVGTVYDLRPRDDGEIELLVAVPAGSGVDAAFASVVLRDLYRRVIADREDVPELEAAARALLGAYEQSPLGRPIELVLARISASGKVRGLVAGLRPPSVLSDGGARPVELGPPLAIESPRLAKPLRAFSVDVGEGGFALFDDGLAPDAPRRFLPDEALTRIATQLGKKDAQSLAEEVVARAVKRYRKRHSDDFLAIVLAPATKRT